MMVQPLNGLLEVVVRLVEIFVGVITVRIVSEFILITFRINEHLGAIRNRGGM
jgi:hypothetical protein